MALDFIAGCLGGCAGLIFGHPFDTVKVNLQTQDAKNPMYRGTYHCLKTIIVKDSFAGLYKGMSSPMGGIAFINAIVFGVYGNVQRSTTDPNSLRSHFVAGSLAGLTQSIICSPMELAKTRLQLQENIVGGVKFKGPIECLRFIGRTEGYRGIFRGLGITALRDVPGFSSYFVSYELLMRTTTEPNLFYILMAGGLAGSISWIFTVPMDVIKSRLQADGIGTQKRLYTGVSDCIVKSYRNEGPSFFFKGLTSSLIRAFPMNAACFCVVSWILKTFGNTNNVIIEENSSRQKQLQILNSNGNVIVDDGGGGLSGGPLMLPIRNFDKVTALNYHRSQTIKGLIFLGAFSEAICDKEILELANDLYDGHDNNDVIDDVDHNLITSLNNYYYNCTEDILDCNEIVEHTRNC